MPNASITDRGNGPGVWVYDRMASTVSFRPVKILRLSEENAYLKEGVHPGDEIVALGAHLLNPGQHVRIAAKETASR